MNMHFARNLYLATLGGACAMLVPATSEAANVGYYIGPACSSSSGFAPAITAAGHTPVQITTLDAPSLSGLGGLVIDLCNAVPVANSALDNAVAGGMGLLYNTWHPTTASSPFLPGAPTLSIPGSYYDNFFCGLDNSVFPGTPVANGPGGPLTNSSFDSGDFCGLDGYATSASLPAGAIPFVSTTDTTQVGAFGYTHGTGRVAFSTFTLSLLMTGGGLPSTLSPGLTTYVTNAVAWLTINTTTCASEGYTGTKLTWCRNICENELSGATLDMWIHRWINRYRDLPYCAVEDEEQPPQEG